MRILVQQKETGLYFKDVGSWTRKSAEAMEFVSSTTAIDFCALNKLNGIQLVLKFDEQKCDIVLPVTSPSRLAAVWPSLALPPFAVALFACNQWLRKGRRRNLSAEFAS